jgi:hypothetical protein
MMATQSPPISYFPARHSRLLRSARGPRSGFGGLAETRAQDAGAEAFGPPVGFSAVKTARRGRRTGHASGVRFPIP